MSRKLRLYVSISVSGTLLPTRQYDILLFPDTNLTVLCALELVIYTQPTYRTIQLILVICGCRNTDTVSVSAVKCILDAVKQSYS